MLRKALFVFWLSISAASVFALPVSDTSLKYDKEQAETAVEVVAKLYTRHINRQLLDDNLSDHFLNKLLDSLDPSRMYLYEKDVEGFKKDRFKYDDYFREGDLNAAFNVYKIYHQRITSRLESVIEQLEDKSIVFDFTQKDSVDLDREKAQWPKTMDEANEIWFKRIKLSVLNLKLAGKTEDEARETVAKRYKNQLNRVRQENSTDVLETVLNSLTMLYDPHTNYWSARTSENFDINMSLSLEGIGAVLQSEDEFTKVVRLVPGGPADKQGQLRAADRVIGVAQGDEGEVVDVIGWRLDDVVQLIRGPKNTTVKLEVLPAGASPGDTTKVVKINRNTVKLEDQSAQKAILTLPGAKPNQVLKIGIIHLPAFYIDFEAAGRRDPNYRSSTRDVAQLIDELKAEHIDGLIMDLRNNGGGSLQEATMLTDLFIDRGVVVQIKTPDGRVRKDNQAYMRPLYNGPMVVLINRLSASASEIFAGAIQDYGRGLVLGSQSFGKGTVQSLTDLHLGKLKLTESKFYRVSGESTQHRGVLPDIPFPSMFDETEVGESAYDNALPWDTINPVAHAKYNDFSQVLPVLALAHDKRVSTDPDFIYLKEQIAFTRESQESTVVSLNEAERIAKKKLLEQKTLDLENKRRKLKGLAIYPTFEAMNKEPNEEDDSAAVEPPHQIDIDGDTILIESGNVLSDFINISAGLQKEQIAKSN